VYDVYSIIIIIGKILVILSIPFFIMFFMIFYKEKYA